MIISVKDFANKEIDKHTPLAHIILNGATNEFLKSINHREGSKVESYDIKMTINGYEIDVEKAFKEMTQTINGVEAEHQRELKNKAMSILEDKYIPKIRNMIEELNTLEEKFNSHIDKFKYEWD